MVAYSGSHCDRSPSVNAFCMPGGRIAVCTGILPPYSRQHECEADKIGLMLMAKAGYDPRAAPDFWVRMNQAVGAGGRLQAAGLRLKAKDERRKTRDERRKTKDEKQRTRYE